MADFVKLSDIRTRIRRLADMENATDFASNAFINDLINHSIQDLIDLLRSHFGHEYHRKKYTFTTASGTRTYLLPSDFLALLWMEVEFSNNRSAMLRPYNIHDAARMRSIYWPNPIYYRMGERDSTGNRLVDFIPTPSSAYTINLYYLPVAKQLVNDDDRLDTVHGWDDYIVWDVVAQLLAKEESDPTFALQQRADVVKRIESLAGATDQGHPDRVGDVQTDDWSWPYWPA